MTSVAMIVFHKYVLVNILDHLHFKQHSGKSQLHNVFCGQAYCLEISSCVINVLFFKLCWLERVL